MEDYEYFNLALDQCKKAYKNDELPVGAVLVINNKIFGSGHNLTNTNNDPLAHCEKLLLEKFYMNRFKIISLVLYVTLEPCAMCYGLFSELQQKYNIKMKIVFGAYNEIFGMTRVMEEEFINKNIEYKCMNDDRVIKIIKDFYVNSNKQISHSK